MAHHIRKISALGLFLLLPLLMAAFSGAQAQFHLAAPTGNPDGWQTQLAQSAAPQAPPQSEAPAAPAEPPKAAPPDFSIVDRAIGIQTVPTMDAWAKSLDTWEETLNAPSVSYGKLGEAREALEGVRGEIAKFVEALAPKLEAAKAQVDNLGAVPEGGEPEAVASQRAELQSAFGALSAARNIAESTRLRSAQLTERVQEIRRRKFAERLFDRVPEAHDSYTWISAPTQLSFALQKAGQTISGWWQHSDRRLEILQTLILGLLIAVGLAFVSLRGIARFRAWDEPTEPPFWRRSTSAAWVILLRLMPFALPSAFIYYGLQVQELMSDDVRRLAYAAMRSILIVATVSALVITALAPTRPHWRLLPMSDPAASRVRWLVVALAGVYGVTLLLGTIRFVANAPFTLTVAQGCVSSLVIAGLVIAILRTPRDTHLAREAGEFDWIGVLKLPLWVIAAVILATAIAGYIGLARFISAQLIVTGTILAVTYLLLIWADAFGQSMGDETARIGKWLKERAGFEQRRREQLALPVTLLLKSVVMLATLPFILLQWGFDWQDIGESAHGLFFGFRIGNTQISIAAILASLVVFGLAFLAARLFQGWLDKQVLTPAGISGGARDSIRTGVGYLGIIIAALFAISYAGLDLSNIALIAGALSVGIGLGLQGVVNNFVSGLILLVERPIKVGDWVVVGDEEGLVRKISVRSTEIETFDRANVVIPNSYFISEKVKNWTLHNYSGRIIIPVGVEYGSSPRRVKEILLKVANDHAQVMTNPQPFVYFDDFGSDALSFKLYAYVYDITKSLGVRTELRIAIVEAFQAEGIEIPYRQTDVHLRGLEGLQKALAAPQLQQRRQALQAQRAIRAEKRRKASHAKGVGGSGGNGGSHAAENGGVPRRGRPRTELS